jgi:hypothetical protein
MNHKDIRSAVEGADRDFWNRLKAIPLSLKPLVRMTLTDNRYWCKETIRDCCNRARMISSSVKPLLAVAARTTANHNNNESRLLEPSKNDSSTCDNPSLQSPQGKLPLSDDLFRDSITANSSLIRCFVTKDTHTKDPPLNATSTQDVK